MRAKILITGSNGFIGKQLKKKLLETKREVIDFNTADGNIANADLNLKNVSHVFHLAGKSFVPESWKTPKAFYETNVNGTLNVLEFARRNNCKLIFVSSYVYGIPQLLPINEQHPTFPTSPYAHSKILAEELCYFYRKNYKLEVAILRPFNIFGPAQKDDFLIPKIVAQLLNPHVQEIKLLDLSPKRDYLFIDDFITALILILEKEKYGTYNIGSGCSLSVEEIIKTILRVSGKTKPYKSLHQNRKNEIPDVVADITRIKNDTGWLPKVSFEEGVRKIISFSSNF